MSLYVYAVLATRAKAPAGVGIGRERVRVARCGRLFAAVGTVTAAPAISPRAVRAHDAVVRRLVARADAVLPARFGTVFPNRDALARSLAEREGALGEALSLVEGREQMTLRLYGDVAGPVDNETDDGETTNDSDDGEKTDETGDEMTTGSAASVAAGAGTRYLTRRARGRDVAALARLRPILVGVVVAERVERHTAPPLLASAYHLIPRGASDEYRARLARASAVLSPLRVAVSGPWPAYAFVPERAG